MYSTRLQIDTKIGRTAGPSSSKSPSGERNKPSAVLRGKPSFSSNAANGKRLRSASNASTSSTMSVISPTYSSSNGSESSVHLPQNQTSTDSMSSPPTSPMLEETIRLSAEYVLAMHDFAPQQQDANCLSFRAGQVIHVLNRDNSGWWDGELEGQRGWFPSNYVNADAGVTSLTEEDLPRGNVSSFLFKASIGDVYSFIQRRRYERNMSSASAASWVSVSMQTKHGRTRSDHRPLVSETLGSDVDSYCPSLMLPLLQGISVLQSAVRSSRMAHFEASTACIISRVKAILAHTDCLGRDSPLLKNFSNLSQERKAMLADLAALVQQTREAISDMIDESAREVVIEEMLKTAGQVFAHTRRFLAIAVQCGVDLPDGRVGSEFGDSTETEKRWSGGVLFPRTDTTPTPYESSRLSPRTSIDRRPSLRDHNVTAIPDSAPRAKSLGNLRSPRKSSLGGDSESVIPLLPHRNHAEKVKKEQYFIRGRVNGGHKLGVDSISSISSYGSLEHPKPSLPPLPQGPCTTAQVMEALRNTHDHYLSTIAAFIGHAHSYSRFSHASTTGKMYELVGEIVDMVCKLLTIVEVIMQLPDIPGHKHTNLKSAKEGLYNVTSSLADSVQRLGAELPSGMTEEDEKSSLLRSATGALKAGADCVAAVKVCLNRSVGEKSFIIYMPTPGDSTSASFTPSKFSKASLNKAHSMSVLNGDYHFGGEEEDVTVQGRTPSPRVPLRKSEESTDGSDDSSGSNQSSRGSNDTSRTSPDEAKAALPPLHISRTPVELDQPSPTSVAPTEDDRTTWAGSQRHHRMESESTGDRHYNGDLPNVPFDQRYPVERHDPMGWMFAHDYPMEDIAYNSEGHIVGATLDVLVTKMTPHESIVDAAFSAIFFLTFRLFASPIDFLEALVARYNIMPPPGAQENEQQEWQQRKGIPIRMRVTNIIKQWVEMYWRPAADNVVIPVLSSFVRDALSPMFPAPCRRILEVIATREQTVDIAASPKGDRIRDPGMSINPPTITVSEIPRPTMTKTLLAALRSKNFSSILITDFDALELARQMTIMENNLYLAIQPQELLETGQQGVKSPLTVKAVSSLSTTITGWVAESILNEHDIKKRTALVKFFIKVADVGCYRKLDFSVPR